MLHCGAADRFQPALRFVQHNFDAVILAILPHCHAAIPTPDFCLLTSLFTASAVA
jgi:hypothetical protein